MPMGVSIPVHIMFLWYVHVRIYTAWVSALLIRNYRLFLRPLSADKQEKKSAFFISILFSLSFFKDNRFRHCLLILRKIKDLVIIVPYKCTDKNRTITGQCPDEDPKKYESEQ